MTNHQIQQRIDEHCHASIDRINSVQWFTRVGLPHLNEDYVKVKAYLEALGCKEVEVVFVARLSGVENCLQKKIDSDWQSAELSRASRLHELIADCCGNQGSRIFNRIFDAIFEPILNDAKCNISEDDSYLSRVAAGSGAETCYLYALESLVSQQWDENVDGIYARKLEIFEQGRWPLCMKNGRFAVF